MSRSLRFAPAFTAIAMASVIAGCAAPQFGTRSASNFGGKIDKANIGVATKALIALNAKDFPTAVKFAEQAVANSPNDAGFRALLGNAYFALGPLCVGRIRLSRFARAHQQSAAGDPQAGAGRNRPGQERRGAAVPGLGPQPARARRLRPRDGAGRSAAGSGQCARGRRPPGRCRRARPPEPCSVLRPDRRLGRRRAPSPPRMFRPIWSMPGSRSGCCLPSRRPRPTRSRR